MHSRHSSTSCPVAASISRKRSNRERTSRAAFALLMEIRKGLTNFRSPPSSGKTKHNIVAMVKQGGTDSNYGCAWSDALKHWDRRRSESTIFGADPLKWFYRVNAYQLTTRPVLSSPDALNNLASENLLRRRCQYRPTRSDPTPVPRRKWREKSASLMQRQHDNYYQRHRRLQMKNHTCSLSCLSQ